VERSSRKPWIFFKSAEITVENVKQLLGVKEDNKLEIIVEGKSFEISIEDDLGLLKNLSRLRISKKLNDARKFSKEEEAEFEALRSTRIRRGAFYDPNDISSFESSSGMTKSGFVSSQKNGESAKIRGDSVRFEIAYADTRGKRPTMEDQVVIFGSFRGNPSEDYVAIFDGHGGEEAAIFSANTLHKVLATELSNSTTLLDVKECLKNAFLKTHQQMKETSSKIQGGTTALVALVLENEAYLANAGDSRAVYSLDGKAVRWSVDHKPNVPSEVKRIESLGGQVTRHEDKLHGSEVFRVNAQLAVSRSLGDFGMQPYVTAEPDIFGPIPLDPQRIPFLILACDGLWDIIDDTEAINIVSSIPNVEEAACRLRDSALQRGSNDNISVIVVRFQT
jgi:serine/threonine protein phosphatase PrpC